MNGGFKDIAIKFAEYVLTQDNISSTNLSILFDYFINYEYNK